MHFHCPRYSVYVPMYIYIYAFICAIRERSLVFYYFICFLNFLPRKRTLLHNNYYNYDGTHCLFGSHTYIVTQVVVARRWPRRLIHRDIERRARARDYCVRTCNGNYRFLGQLLLIASKHKR
jgi:hypothetical protein